jgi:hypothetical protein
MVSNGRMAMTDGLERTGLYRNMTMAYFKDYLSISLEVGSLFYDVFSVTKLYSVDDRISER